MQFKLRSLAADLLLRCDRSTVVFASILFLKVTKLCLSADFLLRMNPGRSLQRLSRFFPRSSILPVLSRSFTSSVPSLSKSNTPRGWTPTPFVTETVVSSLEFISSYYKKVRLTIPQGGGWHTCTLTSTQKKRKKRKTSNINHIT